MPPAQSITRDVVWLYPGATVALTGSVDSVTEEFTEVTDAAVFVPDGWVLKYVVFLDAVAYGSGTITSGTQSYKFPGHGVTLDRVSYLAGCSKV